MVAPVHNHRQRRSVEAPVAKDILAAPAAAVVVVAAAPPMESSLVAFFVASFQERRRVGKRLAVADRPPPEDSALVPRRTEGTILPCLGRNPTTKLLLVLVWLKWQIQPESSVETVLDRLERRAWRHNAAPACCSECVECLLRLRGLLARTMSRCGFFRLSLVLLLLFYLNKASEESLCNLFKRDAPFFIVDDDLVSTDRSNNQRHNDCHRHGRSRKTSPTTTRKTVA